VFGVLALSRFGRLCEGGRRRGPIGEGGREVRRALAKGYEVHGIVRRASTINTGRLDGIYQDPHEPRPSLILHYGDLTDSVGLVNLIRAIAPDEVYNLGAHSHVKVSFEIPECTGETTGMGAVRLLEAIRASGVATRYYQASSSEMFGSAPPPQSELTPFRPRSPYGCAKVYAFHSAVNYREAYGLFACNGILFNHESPRRGETFVTRKVTRLDWERHVRVDARYYRPTEVDHLLGDASKAAAAMGWRPRTGFAELVGLMVDADVALLEDELAGRTVRIDRP
jgi:GDP-D-mannose dehydratase